MANSSHNEDLCLPGVYIFPITLKQCQLNTGCCCKTNHYCCSFPCLAGTSTVGAEQHSSLLQQLVQQQGISSQPLLPPCSSVPAHWLLPHAAHSSVQVDVQPAWSWAQQKPGNMKVWSAASEAVPASPQALPEVQISVAAMLRFDGLCWVSNRSQGHREAFLQVLPKGLAQKPKALVQFPRREKNGSCWIQKLCTQTLVHYTVFSISWRDGGVWERHRGQRLHQLFQDNPPVISSEQYCIQQHQRKCCKHFQPMKSNIWFALLFRRSW